jgi:chorismate synthase
MFSGRLTAPITAAGALAKRFLKQNHGVWINAYISQLGLVTESESFKGKVVRYKDTLCVLSSQTGEAMYSEIERTGSANDSVGGKIATVVSGLEPGLGEPFFESMESEISRMMFSVPAIKAIEFGLGTIFAESRGSMVNDAFTVIEDRICTQTNFNGGILGGMTSGMPVEFAVTVKPTASISMEQDAIDIEKNERVKYVNIGRHDPSVVARLPIVIENATALTILDMIL